MMANLIMAVVLSFFVAGLGIVYAGNLELGMGLVLLWLILCLIALYSAGLISAVVLSIAVIVWVYSLITSFFTVMSNN